MKNISPKSNLFRYVIKTELKQGEQPSRIAHKYNVPIVDVIRINKMRRVTIPKFHYCASCDKPISVRETTEWIGCCDECWGI